MSLARRHQDGLEMADDRLLLLDHYRQHYAKIARQTPESIDFRTPTSVIGVRGTEFVIEAGNHSED